MFAKILGIIFALFIICFVAIFIEEVFLGGRRLRLAKKACLERKRVEGDNV
ncbi:MAG: hypothetical protein H7Y05_10760 [Steroidobacteraceae bacterium]|nr:hypothetical protein [Deltaproteobacteria bacterium]